MRGSSIVILLPSLTQFFPVLHFFLTKAITINHILLSRLQDYSCAWETSPKYIEKLARRSQNGSQKLKGLTNNPLESAIEKKTEEEDEEEKNLYSGRMYVSNRYICFHPHHYPNHVKV